MADIENPGSYNHFLEVNEKTATPESLEEYSEALRTHRLSRAAVLGISLEELHASKLNVVKG